MLFAVRSLRIALLGSLQVEVDGAPLVVDTRKATAMLAFLAISGHAHSRGVLAELLWPAADTERSRSALRRTLSTLRGALGAERLLSDRSALALDLTGAEIDLSEFRRLAGGPDDTAALAAAAALHRGEALEGFALRDSAPFEDWLRELQETVRRERASVLDRLAEALMRDGRFEEAIATASTRLLIDPLHEPTHRRLIDLYARAGRRGDAMTQYRECVLVLDRELGVAPLRETTELYNTINGGEAPVPVAVEGAAHPTTPQLMLVGREQELARVLELHASIADHGAALLIEGESGVGKTRLAAEAGAALAAGGARVLAARAHAGEQGIAYGVITQLLVEAIGDSPRHVEPSLRGELARVLPQLGAPPAGDLQEPGAQLRFLEAISGLIASTLEPTAGVVFVDDLQWCDPASIDALAYLARRLEHRPLLLLGARRTDEPDPDRRYALLAAQAERLRLHRLDRADVISLALRRGLDERDGDRVYRESEGLPLFVAELLARDAANASGSARAALEARFDALGDAAAQVLAAASLIGRTFDGDTLRVASGRSEEEVAAALEELVAHGLVVERGDSYDFGHERLRSMAEERVGLARRRLLHRRIADAHSSRREDPAIVARHYELAGEDARAALAHAAAGRRAQALSAPTEAIAHFEAAIALGHPSPASLHESIGDLHTLRGAYADALASYIAAAAHASVAGAGRIEHKLGGVHERRGELELAEGHYQEAIARGADAAAVQADRSRVAWRRGEHEGARVLAFEALELAQRAGEDAAAAQANNILGLLGCGRSYLERALELARELPDPVVLIAALNNLAREELNGGEAARAETLLREALALCIAHGDLHREAALRNNLADVLHADGRREEAMAELKRSVSGFALVGGAGEQLYPGAWSIVAW